MLLDRDSAEVHASWFRCLADPTRILLLNLLACEARPMTVGEIVELMDVGQSTVSHHLKVLAEIGFVLVTHEGTRSFYHANECCLEWFPTAAELVMGRLPRYKRDRDVEAPPWIGRSIEQQQQDGPKSAERNRGRLRRRTRT